MEMERDKVYTSIPPQYGFKCPKCGAFEFSTTPEYDDEQPDAIPASEARQEMEPKFRKGDHVWAKNTKELVGRTGYVKDFDRYKREYFVAYDKEMWIVPEDELELVDPKTEEYHGPAYKVEEEQEGLNCITDAVEAMYHHTKKANVAYYWMVATVIATFAMTGLGKVAALMAFASLLFSLGQNVWQGVTLEAFIRKMDAQHKTRFDYYPDHISNGGWVLYIVKMLLAVTAIVLMLLNV